MAVPAGFPAGMLFLWLCLVLQIWKYDEKNFFLNTFPGMIFVKYGYAIVFDILKAFSNDPF